MNAPFIRQLDDLDGTQVGLAGGKGASLGELIRAGVRVPPGFVVTRPAFDAFLRGADPDGTISALLEEVDAGRLEIAPAAVRIDQVLGQAPMPESVVSAIEDATAALGVPRLSVRSSATCEDGNASAWAGQLETFLNVAPDDVVSQVRACWLSMFRASALAYGAAHGYGAGEFGVAVVVQQMVASEVSGIGFSVHPVTQEPDLRLIEACFGQGEAIVSGQVDPDQYVVERGARRIVQSSRGRQRKGLFFDPDGSEGVWRELGERGAEPKLTDEEVLEYAALLDRLEEHYGHPIDTEWARARGAFYLLQARPITTLAAEYREQIIDTSEPWVRSTRRPLTLLEVSIVAHWLDSKHSAETIGFYVDRYLSIQDTAGMATSFLPKRAALAAREHVRDLERNDRARLVAMLRHAHQVFEAGRARLDNGEGFRDLEEAAEYLVEIGQQTTGFPLIALLALSQEAIDDPEVRELAEGLRARSLYPRLAHEWVIPLVKDRARELGFSDPERAPEVMTWRELSRGADVGTFEARLEEVDAGRRFVFQALGNRERVRFVLETGYLLMRLAGRREIVPPDDPDRISGQAAWPGIHRGRARVILSSDPTGVAFADGDVLVSIQSSPNLMPLLRHAGAIVTDEGGVACHAGIICRELKIPTIIGTGRATSTIHDGDMVEVDATEQVVRIVERST